VDSEELRTVGTHFDAELALAVAQILVLPEVSHAALAGEAARPNTIRIRLATEISRNDAIGISTLEGRRRLREQEFSTLHPRTAELSGAFAAAD
jgi:hypothetical protein